MGVGLAEVLRFLWWEVKPDGDHAKDAHKHLTALAILLDLPSSSKVGRKRPARTQVARSSSSPL